VSEYDFEPVRGLPENLPEGERILWQGAPDWRLLARDALHVRIVGGYFGLLAAWRILDAVFARADLASAALGAILLAIAGAICVGILALYAFLAARMSVYTITTRRVVLRIGVAIPKAINVPFAIIGSVDLRRDGEGGDIALSLTGNDRIGYLHLWPHARPGRMARPEPTLRALADASPVAGVLAAALVAYDAEQTAAGSLERVPRPAVAPAPAAEHPAPAGAAAFGV
jgi:hypothetical protein